MTSKAKKAPGWIMAATLFIIFIFALIAILTALGIAPSERISFGNEYGESCSISYNPYSHLLNLLSIVFFIMAAVLSIVKKWGLPILCGSILMIVDNGIGLLDYMNIITANNMESLMQLSSPVHVYAFASINTILYLAGSILIFIGSEVKKAVRISGIVFVVLFCIIGFINIHNASLIIQIIKAIAAISLSALCFYKKDGEAVNEDI